MIRLWEAVDGEGIFRGYAPAGYRAGGKWCFTAEAAEHYEVSPSTAVIWVKCFRETGQCAAKPRGGSTSPLEKHANFLLALIEVEPDLTLDEVLCAMRKHKVPGSRTAVWRFFQRYKIAFKKSLRAAEQERADVARARRGWKREQGLFDPARLVFIDGVLQRRTERKKMTWRQRRKAVRKMRGGPSGSAFRSRSQTSPSCCGKEPWW
ncbi:MAG TPA: hypothetical protein VFB24_09815 [Candidatus Binatia bacterium]|nr:hypothetical protein [Candidatus Binatia bacterium]